MTHLKRTIPSIPVTYYDERFTSVLAHKAMLEGGLKKNGKIKDWSMRLAPLLFCKLI